MKIILFRVKHWSQLTLSLPIPLRLYTLPYWSNQLFFIFHARALCMALKTERQSVRVSKMKYNGLDQYGAEPFEQQQFGTADAEGIEYNACSVREPCVFGTIIVQETSFD